MNAVRPTDVLRLLRPHQWLKNLFVFTGLLFGHAWSDPVRVQAVLAAAAAFCLVSSSVYVFNDFKDRERDRQHPVKRKRPLAAGRISAGMAVVIGLVLAVAGLALGFSASPAVVMVLAAYMVMNAGYSLGLKHVVILDVFLIAAGFMLRILAGTLGVGIPPSQWLLLCGLMVTLFLGFAKRRAEISALAEDKAAHRQVLEHYGPVLLDKIIGVNAAGVIMSYSLYTMNPATIQIHGTPNLIYTVPFVMYAIFRYIFLLHQRGGGGDPALEMLRDRHLLAAGFGWLATTVWLIAL